MTFSGVRATLRIMRALSVMILLVALVLPSGHAPASPPIDISAEELQTLHTQAAQGNAAAQYNLGVLYANGRGVPQDYVQARQWYEQAAAQGHREAQYNLGVLYDKGHGVPQDYVQARQWYEQAAAQGFAMAQLNLGVLYHNGQGIPQDDVRAYMWYNLATPQLTGDNQKLVADNRDRVARRMTPAQLAEAQRLASQCQTQQFKGC